jgi:osmotically-inducible protein OsmY
MRADTDLQHDVLEELQWEPSIDAARIGVAADHGVVTLTGHVDNYAEKVEAEKAAKRVAGVEAVANDLEVRHMAEPAPDDPDIAQRALSALDWNVSVPKQRLKVTVTQGWVTLDGDVDWYYQKRAAEDAVHDLMGVRGITNSITVTPRVRAAEVKEKIDAALRRSAEVDAKKIVVDAAASKVTLRGTVRSWAEHEDVLNAAWSAPGVTAVEDHLSIRP